jgi:hypothetical protein
VAFSRGNLVCVTNLGEPLRLPSGARVLLASEDVETTLGHDVTVWFTR